MSQIQKVVNDTISSKRYEKLKGYAQVRYSRLFETNKDLTHPTNDKSFGNNQGFFLRRARLNFYGDVSSRVFIYIQADYSQDSGADSAPQNYLQLRDAFFDYALTENKEWLLRTGVSKVTFGLRLLLIPFRIAPLTQFLRKTVPMRVGNY